MTTLTDADRSAIAAMWIGVDGTAASLQGAAERTYLAGIAIGKAAGRIEGLEEAAKIAMNTPDKFGSLADDSHKECALVAARLIRAARALPDTPAEGKA